MADNEVVVRSGRKIAIGSDWWEIRDTGAPVHHVDILTEARNINGCIYLSFASGVIDANNEGFAQVASRLRMNFGVAQMLHNMLGDMIKDALTPPDPSKAN